MVFIINTVCGLGRVSGLPSHLGIQRSLSEKGGMFLGCNAQFVVISMVPNLFHVVPVSDNAMLNGIFEVENTPFCLGFVSIMRVSVAQKVRDGTHPTKESL